RGEAPELDIQACEGRLVPPPRKKQRQSRKKKDGAAGPPAAVVPPIVEEEEVQEEKVVQEEVAAQEEVVAPAAPAAETAKETAPDAPAPAASPSVPGPPPPPPPPLPQDPCQQRSAWRAIFHRKMTHHRNLRSADPLWEYHRFWHTLTREEKGLSDLLKKPLHQLEGGSENLEGDDVVLSIATVWAAYNHRRGGHGRRRMALVIDSLLLQMRYAVTDDAAYELGMKPVGDGAGGRNDLLVPIIFASEPLSPDSTPDEIQFVHPKAPQSPAGPPSPPPPPPPPTDQQQGEQRPIWVPPVAGHILLGVASATLTATGHHITLTTYDSVPNYMPHARILRAARRVIRRCGWLGSDALGNCANLSLPGAPTITYGKTNRVRVPRQVSPDSCGIHTILNAWILLLGLPGIQHRARYGTTVLHKEEENDEEAFMKQALEVVNLALGGWMDARTIQAFLCGFGFVECVAGPPGVEEEAGWVDDVGMARMTAGLLQSVLDESREEMN
ncbi:MAG: hypothetical protein Q9203_006117, partial [Teloschistes exilis]